MADRFGNVFVGRDREFLTMAHAAERTIATVETLHDGNLLEDPILAAGTVPGFYVETVAVAPRGAWPLPFPDHYPAGRRAPRRIRQARRDAGRLRALSRSTRLRQEARPECPDVRPEELARRHHHAT